MSYPIGQDVADMKSALRAGKEYLDHDAEWWAEQLESVFTPELIEDVTGIPQAAEAVERTHHTIMDPIPAIMAGLHADGTYDGHDKYWWFDCLYNNMLPERRDEPGALAFLQEITTVSAEDYFNHMMEQLEQFKADGSGYHDGLESHFPLFKGDPPEGHPYPKAFKK